MPPPGKTKSPARAGSNQRSKSPSRKSPSRKSQSPARARSRQRRKSPSRQSKSRSRSRDRNMVVSPEKNGSSEITTVTTSRQITKRVSRSSIAVSQEKASVTPVRQSSQLASLVEPAEERITTHIKPTVSVKEKEQTKPKTKSYEFGGPIGTFFLIFLLPLTVYCVNLACRKGKCSILEVPQLSGSFTQFVDMEATVIYLGWFLFQAVLAVLPIGRVVEGQPLRNGQRLKYRLNGFSALFISLLCLGLTVYFKVPLTVVHAKFFKLLTTAVVFSFTLSIFLYIKSRFVPADMLAEPGNTGNVVYDFFMGRELNPRMGPLDLKFFCELRPGLIGWAIMNLVFLLKAYQEKGSFPPGITMVVFFQFVYVADALVFEEAILTTMDIIHDGFGFMLAFGDLAWVPFLYCLQPRYLLETGYSLPWYCLAPIAVLNIVGYVIFRMSNLEKNNFRRDPSDPALAHLETISTPSGKRLLVSGWWGLCRKPNYLGDIIMAVAWSLPCGFNHILPYFYPIYFFILLVHRERRDSELCRRKYGVCWDRYCERVRYRIIPYVY